LELNQLPKEKFDYIFCIAVLHHLPGQDLQIKALKQMGDKLSADGELIISVWNLWSQKKMRKRIARFFFLKILGKSKMDIGDIIFDWKGNKKKKNSQRYYHAFTKRELKKIIKKAGLTPKNIYQDKYNYFATATRHQ
jgi:2-polyprenyl-3-methyl-5-hydroxy-6-metoxy-1,4-benzoquinol methylase